MLTAYVCHYHTARPHRGLDLALPVPDSHRPPQPMTGPVSRIERFDVLGGLIHDYRHAA